MMRLPEQFLDELKSRLRPSEVIGKRVPLKKQGREWAGLSPFSKEKTPSFFVNDDKGFYHCFSSGKHGDVISFLQETERLSFMEAVEKLAAEAGMSLPAPDPQTQAAQEKAKGLYEALEAAANLFEAELRRVRGQGARAYLEKRGVPEVAQQRFRLGFAPEGPRALKDELVAKGFEVSVLVAAGLVIKTDRGDVIDRFRNRLMFPIVDHRSRVVAFGGRALDPQARAKYLNSPETPVFHKGNLLYNLTRARAERERDEAVLVVEGYMDVIACDQAGLQAVAPMGTAITEQQIERLWHVVDEPVMCFDGDKAGRGAARRAISRTLPILKPGKSLNFVWMPEGQDPDDLLRSAGPEALRAAVAHPKPMVEVLFQTELEATPITTPERVAGLKSRLYDQIRTIEHKDVAEAYRNALRQMWQARFQSYETREAPAHRRTYEKGTYGKGRYGAGPYGGRGPARQPVAKGGEVNTVVLRQFLHSLVARPELLAVDIESLAELHLPQPEDQKLLDCLVSWTFDRLDKSQALDKSDLMGHLRCLGFSRLDFLISSGGPQQTLDFAADTVPIAQARPMMLDALSRLASVLSPALPPGHGPSQTAARGLASLASARRQAEVRKATSGSDTDKA